MTTSALVMLLVAIGVIWGGLALALINLMKHPELPDNSTTAEADATN